MIWAQTITVPKSTVPATPLVRPWIIPNGLIYKVEISFPPGPSGYVGVQLKTASHNLYPADEDQWFIGDNDTLSFEDEYMFNLESKQIDINCYNEDETYDHTIQVRLGIITDEAIIRSRFGYASIDALIIKLDALIAVLQAYAVISGKYDKSAIEEL